MRGLFLFVLMAAGCSSCPGDGLDVDGHYGYRRCAFAAKPHAGTRSVGALRLVTKDRTLTIEGVGQEVRLAAFSGPAPGRLDTNAVKELRARKLDLALLLGGLGDDDTVASETLEGLASLSIPTLVVPGGRDSELRLNALHSRLPKDAQEKIVLLAPYRSVLLLGHEFIVVAGAEEGRYGVDNSVCGFDLSDLQTIARDVGPAKPKVVRSLWSWAAPGRGGPLGVGRTERGVDVGSAMIAEFSERVGAKGGLYAWPTVRAASPVTSAGKQPLAAGRTVNDLRVVVPRLGTLPLLLADGGRVAPGFAVLKISEGGMTFLGRVELGASANSQVAE